MQLTKIQKKEIIKMLETVDVKRLEIELDDASKLNWFRFGSYNGLTIAIEIIKVIKEKPVVKAKTKE